MSTAINNGTFTFTKEELKDWSKVIHALLYDNVDLTKIHTIEEGLKYNQQIVFSNSEGLLGKLVAGCTPHEISGITLTDKLWTPVFEDFRLTHCSADVNQQDKLVNQMKKMNPDFYKIFEGSQSATGAFLTAAILERLQMEILRKVWFNATGTLTVTGGGTLTDGTDVGYFNTFNGIFQQFMGSSLATTNRVAIAENQLTTTALQTALAAGRGKEILKALYYKADPRLRSAQGTQFLVTSTIYDAYMTDLEAIENAGAGNITTTTDGKTMLKYRGLEVIKMDNWDRTIGKYYTNGTKLNLPNRAVLTVPRNIPVGTLSKGDFGTLEAFYDQYHKVNVIDGVYSIDAKILEDYLIYMAY